MSERRNAVHLRFSIQRGTRDSNRCMGESKRPPLDWPACTGWDQATTPNPPPSPPPASPKKYVPEVVAAVDPADAGLLPGLAKARVVARDALHRGDGEGEIVLAVLDGKEGLGEGRGQAAVARGVLQGKEGGWGGGWVNG